MKKNRIAGTDMIALTWIFLLEEDQDRIGRLWTEVGDTLVRWSYDRLGRTATYKDAEDIVTEAFARLIEHYERYERCTDRQMKSILLRTCSNLCINEYRRSRHMLFTSFDETEEKDLFPDPEPSAPEDFVISDETVARLKRIIHSLDGKYREVLEMKILDELPDSVIAEELGIPKATMQTRLMRGRRLVIEKWEKEEAKK